MSDSQTNQSPASVKFLFWRTSRPVAVAVCLTLIVAALLCTFVGLEGPWDSRWLRFAGVVLAGFGGGYCNAILRTDRYGG
jgi:hypothetical protein